MTIHDDSPDAPVEGTVFNNRQVRILKFVVIGMGVLLLLGFATVLITIVYQASQLGNPSSAPAAAVSSGTGPANIPLAEIPVAKEAKVIGTALDGHRLAVTLKNGSATTIMIVDTRTGKVLSRTRLVPRP